MNQDNQQPKEEWVDEFYELVNDPGIYFDGKIDWGILERFIRSEIQKAEERGISETLIHIASNPDLLTRLSKLQLIKQLTIDDQHDNK